MGNNKDTYENGLNQVENEEKALTPHGAEYPVTVDPEKKDDKDRYYEIFDQNKEKTRVWSVASLVVAVASVVCCAFGWIGVILALASVVLSAVSRAKLKYFDGMAIAGLIIGIFGIVFSGTILALTYIVGLEELKWLFNK